jgi:hypothetical protein
MPIGTLPSIGVGPLVLLASGTGLVIRANILFFNILGEVNGASPEDRRIDVSAASVMLFTVFSRHRELCPKSRKRSVAVGCAALGFLLVAAACMTWVSGPWPE